MADTKLAKVGITLKERWMPDISFEALDFTLWRTQDGGDGRGYIAKQANIGVRPDSDDSVWLPATEAGSSIYDLAVKYGYEGTEAQFVEEYNAAVAAANAAAASASAVEAQVAAAEASRVGAENSRVQAEAERQSAEQTRVNNEAERANNETARSNNEAGRVAAETDRAAAENGRQTAESTRQSNETARENAEQERTADFEGLKTDMQTAIQQADAATAAADEINRTVQQNEASRQQAESGRAAAETQRQTAETQRGTNESTRQTQETARQTAETSRQTAEATRGTNENARQTAEAARSSAENTRQSSEASRRTAETARETQAESDHSRADSDHAIAEEDHATLDEKISHKADIDGSYDGMAVGIARNLEGRTDVTDSFFKRTTGGDAEVANGTAQLNEVKGKSQVWNQLIQNGDFSDGTYGWYGTNNAYPLSVSNGVLTWVSALDGALSSGNINRAINFTAGHKFLISFEAKASEESIINCALGSVSGGGSWSLSAPRIGPSWKKLIAFSTPTTATTSSFYIRPNSNGTPLLGLEVNIRNVIVIDLTLLGIDNLTTVEEVVAWLAENIGEQAYYPYNAGEVLNNRMTGVESIGFNLLDPVTGKADIIGAYSDVYGNYYGITGTHGAITFTDKFGNSETITPDEDGKFLLEKAGTLTVATPGEDCAVFLWWDGTQTEYKPYEKNEGKLDVTHIYGKLNGEGEYVRVWPNGMAGFGDVKDLLTVEDGVPVARRLTGEVDLGTLNWNYASAQEQFSAQLTRKTGLNVLCGKYPTQSGNTYADKYVYAGSYYGTNAIRIKDTAYSDDAATFKAAQSGVLLYYELATPKVFTDLIYRDSEAFADGTPVTLPVNYKVDNWGIERIAPQNTEESVVTTKPELTMRYSIDAVEELNTHRDEIDDLYEKNEELDERKPEKYGEYPDMAVGSAKTLAGQDTKVEDFFFKPIDCADGLAKLNSARGKSLVWNQLELVEMSYANRNDFSWQNVDTETRTYQDGIAKVDIVDESENAAIQQVNRAPNVLGGHKYYIRVFAHTDGTLQMGFNGAFTLDAISQPNGYIRFVNVASPRYLSTKATVIANTGTFLEFGRINVIDLTLMFGAGNEPATVEEFESMFPLPYYDYNPGEIISNKTEEVKVTGFNQWDEEWELGTLSGSTGAKVDATNRIRCKNFIRALPNTEYYTNKYSSVQYVICYDSNYQYIGQAVYRASSQIFVTVAGTAYIKICFGTAYGTTYNHDICINLSDPARNGEYEPYKTNTVELNLPTLTGKLNGEGESVVVFPDGLKSAGSVYDEIVGNKAIKRVGVVDLGTLDWTVDGVSRQSSNGIIPYVAKPSSGSVLSQIICEKYLVDTAGNTYNHTNDKRISITTSGSIAVYDSAYTDAATFKSAMSGVLLYYELATPEEYILDAPLPDTFQAYKGGTIKQLPENTSEPVTAPMVMTVTYAIDAVGTLVGLPRNYVSKESLQAMLNAMQSAGIIASYTMTYNENTGKYDFTFVAPTNS